jgi:hypothetical protein
MQRESRSLRTLPTTVKAGSSIPDVAWPQPVIAVLDPNAACSWDFRSRAQGSASLA